MKWKSLHMPKSIDVDEATLTDSYGKFEIQPLERGFGITIGNALRRVLLSSIQGAAINSIRFKIILEAIEKFVEQNAYFSSEKIFDLLAILLKHQKLETKLEIIIKGEKFKVFFFIFLLPLITGVIGGMFPLFVLLNRNIQFNNDFSLNFLLDIVYFKDIIIVFFTLISIITITSYYFLKIINYNRRFLIVIIANIMFIMIFFISLLNVLNFL